VRGVLAQLDNFANRYGVAVLGITHPPKMVPGSKAINAVSGSLAFVAAARMAFLVTADPADPERRLMTTIKNNLGAEAYGLAYRITTRTVGEDIVASFLSWDSTPITMSANEALSATNDAARERADQMREAEDFLLDLLAGGPAPAEEGQSKAKAAGIKDRTLSRARKKLGIIAKKDNVFQGRWTWSLP
jgi:hypothetical protein